MLYNTLMRKLHSVVWKEDKYYVAKALEVEVASQGLSVDEALSNLKEALELYFEDNTAVDLIEVDHPQIKDVSIQVNA
jgi:predicted RNase H-like HicB family nuclease